MQVILDCNIIQSVLLRGEKDKISPVKDYNAGLIGLLAAPVLKEPKDQEFNVQYKL